MRDVAACLRVPWISDVVHDHHALTAAVVAARDSAKALLAGRIPALKHYRLAINLHRSALEVHTNCGQVVLLVLWLGEPEEEVGFADARVSDDEHFGHKTFRLLHARRTNLNGLSCPI